MADGSVKVLTFVQVAASHHHLVRETSVVTESREAVRIRQALNMKMNGNFNQNFPTPQTWDYKLLRYMSSPSPLSSSSSTSWAPTPRLASAHWWRGPKPRQAPAPSPLFRPCCSRFTLLDTPTVVVVVVDVFEYVFVAAMDVHLDILSLTEASISTSIRKSKLFYPRNAPQARNFLLFHLLHHFSLIPISQWLPLIQSSLPVAQDLPSLWKATLSWIL